MQQQKEHGGGNPNFQGKYFFDNMQKKIIIIQPEMIVWLLVRNFFRGLQKKYSVKAWFREDKICLTGQVLDNINKAYRDIEEATQTHTMDFIWRSEDNDLLMDRIFTGFSVNQDYEKLLQTYPLLLIIKRQKFRKVSLWLKNNGYSGLDNIYPVLPAQFVMIFAPKKEKQIIMQEISRISNFLRSLLSNQITPGEEQYFDLKGFSNFQIKKSFIYSSKLHVLNTIKVLTFCVDYNIKYFQEKFNVYLDFKTHPVNKDKIYLRIHAVRDLDIFTAEENLLQFLEVRITVMVDLEEDTQDEMMNKISLFFSKPISSAKFFKSSELTQMANAFDQFYQTSMLEALTAMDNYTIPKLVITLDEWNLNKVQSKINDFFETPQPLYQFDIGFQTKKNLHQSQSQYESYETPTGGEPDKNQNVDEFQNKKQIQLQQSQNKSFETPTSLDPNPHQLNYLNKQINYLCIQLDEKEIELIFYNYEGLRFKGFTFDLVDFSHYIQKHYPHPKTITPIFQANKLSFRVKYIDEINDIEVMQILDRYMNYELIYLQKQKLTTQLKSLIKEMEANFSCDTEIHFINCMNEKNMHFPEDLEYEELWIEIKQMSKGTKVCAIRVYNVGHSQKNKVIKALQQIFNQCK